MPTSRPRRLAVFTVTIMSIALSAAAVPGAPASAAPATDLQLISGPDPLPAAGTPGACGSSAEFQGWEQEPTLAVDPSSDANLVAAWIQDYSDAIVTANSSDGGRSWTISVPKTVACTGGSPQYGQNASAFDPKLAFGPADPLTGKRTVFLSSVLSVPTPFGPLSYAVVVHHSKDGGKTWSAPVTVAQATAPLYLDGTTIVADPARVGRAYVAWREGDFASSVRQQLVARTDDGGATWSPGLPIRTQGLQLNGHLHVLRDGSVVNLMSSIPVPPPGTDRADIEGPTTLLAVRSTDLGTTWSAPVTIAVADEKHLATLGSTVAPDGDLYVSWQRAGSGTSSVLIARSTTGGRSWGSPQLVATVPGDPLLPGDPLAPVIASPEIAVLDDGTVGVGFFDHRNATAASPGTSDYWLRTAHKGRGPWREEHVAGPFDVSTAPLGMLGDYQGIVALSDSFGLALSLTGPPVATPPTDIVWATAG